MPRNLKIFLVCLAVAVVIGLISLRSLRNRMQRLRENETAEEQARREVLAPPISTPTDVMATAMIYWAAGPDKIAPVQVQLALSADPIQRSKQVLLALVASPPTPAQRTLPADTILLSFYVLPNGTAIADFSDVLASEMPSGILSEQMAVDSIAKTLANNVPVLQRLKILIHGQEMDTLAGHVDLTGFFILNPAVPALQGSPNAAAQSPAITIPAATNPPSPSAAPAVTPGAKTTQ